MSEEENVGTYVAMDAPLTEQNEEEIGEEQPAEDEPLIHEEDEKKNKRKKRKKSIVRNLLYACLALVILIIVTAITTVLIILYGRETKQKPLFGYDDMFNDYYKPKSMITQWSLNDGTHPTLSYWDGSTLKAITPGVGTKDLINSDILTTLKASPGSAYTLTKGGRFVLLKTKVEKIWRRSSWGEYVAYDTVKKVAVPNFPSGTRQRNLVSCPLNESLIAYVDENNDILVRDLTSDSPGVKITSDGKTDYIFNGVSDWVYEEDVLEDYNTMFFSADCKSLAYIKLDDSLLDIYYDPNYAQSSSFPTYTNIRYPIVGRPIPKASLHVYEIDTKQTLDVTLATNDKDLWIYDVKWSVGNNLAITVFPRDQRTKNVTLATKTGGVYKGTVAASFKTSTWFPARKEACYVSETRFLDVLPYNDRYAIHATEGGKTVVFAHGEYDVEEIFCEGLARAPTNNFVTFRAINGLYSSLYRLNVVSGAVEAYTDEDAYYTAQQDPTGTYSMVSYEGPSFPYQELRSATDWSLIQPLHNNDDLKDKLDHFELPAVDLSQTLSVSGVSREMDMMVIHPPYFSDSDVYPALIHVYGGPSSKTVSGRYSAAYDPFNLYLASQGFLIATVDGRGTRGKGESFMTTVYGRLGFLETDDQVALRGYLGDLSYVDKTKISIWGWSYGGFMTLFGTAKDTAYVSAVAVAPDCSHRGYDAAYSERYMGSGSNYGYNNSNILNRVDGSSFKDTELLLVHGMSDDNVHPFNTYNLMSTLQEFEIQFDLMMFPNKAHSLLGDRTRKFLFKKIGDFFINNGK